MYEIFLSDLSLNILGVTIYKADIKILYWHASKVVERNQEENK